MGELDLAGIDTTSLFIPNESGDDDKKLDLSGIDTSILFPKKNVKVSNPAKIEFDPSDSNWNLNQLSSIEQYFQNTFKKSLPVINKGQGAIHNKWHFDHRDSADIGLSPNSDEGRKLVEYLKENNIPFMAFNRAIPGVATGAHIHIGRPSKKTGERFTIGTAEDKKEIPKLNLEGIDTSILEQTPILDLKDIDTTSLIADSNQEPAEMVTDLSLATDPSKIDFKSSPENLGRLAKAAKGFTQSAQAQYAKENPDTLGDPVILEYKGKKPPNLNLATDLWLSAWNPEYKKLNDKYRAETGGLNIADLGNRGNIVDEGMFKYKIQARPTRAIEAQFQAYRDGGIKALFATAALANQQRNRHAQLVVDQQAKIDEYKKEHPYLSAIEGGFEQEAEANFRLLNNISYIGKALYTGEKYGYTSQQYLDLIEQEKKDALAFQQGEANINKPEGFIPEILQAGVGTILAMPRIITASRVMPGGLGGFTTMAYLENLHRGTREAAIAALPAAIMEGSLHGFNEHFNSGTPKTINTLAQDSEGNLIFDEAGDPIPVQQTVIENAGAGNRAAFARTSSKELSLFQESLQQGRNVSIEQFSPLARQLLLRGTNALVMTGASLIGNELSANRQPLTTKGIAANLVVGLAFPIGKGAKKAGFTEFVKPQIEKEVLQLGQPRVDTEVPARTLRGENFVAQESDKGTISLPLDTAALHYLDLERSLKEGTYKNKGDNLGTDLEKQRAINEAMGALKEAIPEFDKTIGFFRNNENSIRTALRTNYEANQTKQSFLERRAESFSPDGIKTIPESSLDIKPIKTGNETAQETFGNVGSKNKFTSQEKANEVLQGFFKLTNNNSILNTSLFGADIVGKKLADTGYLAAFYIEDLYHRGIEPTLERVINRLKISIGGEIDEKAAKDIFENGMNYWQSNQADPFFSKMKQDALERLPNRFNVEQARNILSQHENEFEWTAGLQDFLSEKESKGEKVSRNELVDIIQRGQVRVEASVADESYIHYDTETLTTDDPALNELYNEYGESLRDRYDSAKNAARTDEEFIAIDKKRDDINTRVSARERELDRINQNTPKYSLKAYSGEQLELPGAENSKEVKLISAINIDRIEIFKLKFGSQNWVAKDKVTGEVLITHSNKEEVLKLAVASNKGLVNYVSPHWHEIPNVVAHYRSSDRISTDGNRLLFGEEFQSDWNHDIRERGLKVSPEKLIELQREQKSLKAEQMQLARDNGSTRLKEISDRLDEINREIFPSGRGGVEPNPFMAHNWKELVLKRFLRDAAIAIDENYPYRVEINSSPNSIRRGEKVYSIKKSNGKYLAKGGAAIRFDTKEEAQQYIRDNHLDSQYKYDAIGWTTARQQQERYGKVLEGKDFDWRKNSDGTYTFGFRNSANEAYSGYDYPHELNNISLERFAELATKEAAQEVRDQEKGQIFQYSVRYKTTKVDLMGIYDSYEKAQARINELNSRTNEFTIAKEDRAFPKQGKFSLKEAVELRSGIGKYSDYDIAYKNILSKIGKRFGGRYGEREILLGDKKIGGYDWIETAGKAREAIRNGEIVEGKEAADNGEWIRINNSEEFDKGIFSEYRISQKGKFTTIHSLEITPSMRASIEREGFPLYGTGGSEPLKSQEVGIRNRITTQQGFDQHRNDLVQSLKDIAIPETNNPAEPSQVFNSGLSPDAFVDFAKITFQDVKDFAEFSKELVSRFGELVKPYLTDLWVQVKGFTSNIRNSFDIAISDVKNAENSPAFKARQVKEGGFIKLQTAAGKAAKQARKKIPYYEWYSLWRMVGISQLSTEAGQVADIMRGGQRVRNSFESTNLFNLRSANELVIKSGLDQAVADNIWIGNEEQKTYNRTELSNGDPSKNRPALSADQIKAYKYIRKSVNLNLDIRSNHKLYSMRQKAQRLNNQLLAATPGTPEYSRIQTSMVNLSDEMNKLTNHFNQLKDSGYISTQRRGGNVVAYTEDPAFPVGDSRRTIYQHFKTIREADAFIREQETNLAAINSDIYDLKQPERLRVAAAKLTPSQFEDLLDSAGVYTNTPEIDKIRNEVYSRYPSMGYELKRDYIRGYDRNWQFVLDSVAHQTETYSASFYSKVAGEEALKQLESLGLQQSNYSLYQVMQKYVDHEISAPEMTSYLRATGGIRKGVYLFQLGYDVNQLYLNALAQPLTQTYSYFSRASGPNGEMLKGLDVERYFIKGARLAGNLARESVTGKNNPNLPQEFRDIYSRLVSEKVVEAEFNRSLLEAEAEKSVSAQVTPKTKLKRAWHTYEHWAGTFMRAGEKTTRTHVAAEAYLVGKEKFNLAGEELVNFIVKAVDATQSNPSRAEAPLLVRGSQNQAEIRKLLYQFNAFNHMWIENLALNVKSDFQNRRIASTARHLAPLVLMGGIRGLPLAGFAGTLYTLISGDDPKKKFDDLFGKDSTIESLALYGVTGNEALSNRLTPSIPLVDNIKIGNDITSSVSDTFSTSNIPAVATAAQIARGFSDLAKGQKLRAIGEMFPFKPVRNLATAERYREEGIRTRSNRTLVPRSKVTSRQIFAQTIGLSPTPLLENYNRQKTKKIIKLHKKIPLIKKI